MPVFWIDETSESVSEWKQSSLHEIAILSAEFLTNDNLKKLQIFKSRFLKNLVTSGDLKLVTSLVTSEWRSPEVTRKKKHAP